MALHINCIDAEIDSARTVPCSPGIPGHRDLWVFGRGRSCHGFLSRDCQKRKFSLNAEFGGRASGQGAGADKRHPRHGRVRWWLQGVWCASACETPIVKKTLHRYEGTRGELMRTHASMLSRAFIPPCIIADVSRKTAALGPAPAHYAGRNPSCLLNEEQNPCQITLREFARGFAIHIRREGSKISPNAENKAARRPQINQPLSCRAGSSARPRPRPEC